MTTSPQSSNNDDGISWSLMMESASRITLASVGGGLAGLARMQRTPGQPTHLPRSWALSCTLFALVLESCRWTSPTSRVLTALYGPEDKDRLWRVGVTALGNYGLGGSVAGLAGALGQRGKVPILWGLRIGAGLGVLAGGLQAMIDMGEVYAKQQAALDQFKELVEEETKETEEKSAPAVESQRDESKETK